MVCLQDLPPPLLRNILLCLSDDPVSVCRVACTCQDLKTIAEEEPLWDILHRHRWKTQSPLGYNKANYQRRNEIDADVIEHIKNCGDPSFPHRKAVECCHRVQAYKHDALEVCWKVAEANEEKEMAISIGRMIQCSCLINQVMEMQKLAETADPRTQVEEYAILVSSLFFARPPFEAKAASLRQQLDDIATTIQARLPQSASVEQKVNAVNLVLFDEMLFSGNSDNYAYLDHRNSLLHEALERKTANALTLVVIYQAVARRLGVDVDILALPLRGHIVARIPVLERYVDVFTQGRILSRQDCVSIVNSYGIEMRDDFLQPLAAIDIRICICEDLVMGTYGSQGGQLQALAVRSISRASSLLVPRGEFPGSDFIHLDSWVMLMTLNRRANIY